MTTRNITTEQGKCRECIIRADIGSCNQHLLRDTTFNKWLQCRKSDHKLLSARCNTCYDQAEQSRQHMQRATSNMVMKTQPEEPVIASTQAKQVSMLCPQGRTQKRIDMAKCWKTMRRNRFIKERCTECKTHAHRGNWLRYNNEIERTTLDWLSAIE